MRNLIWDGWITFCMCAMLVSFASYQIWLDWRITGNYLARLFTDFRPRFHYSQLQMQSGDTGINAMRVYNIIKQLSMIQMVTILENGCQNSVDSRFNKNKTSFKVVGYYK
jgi:deoxyribodipyrimidine photolyase